MTDAAGNPLYATPYAQFRYGVNNSVKMPCLATTAFSPGINVPCVNGIQNFNGYEFPGMITNHSLNSLDFSVAGKWQVPINFHIGSMGLAPPAPNFVNSIPPMVQGGNLDDRRIGVGAAMYYPVGVAGALLSMGDAHTAQGDSELDGTGIETSITGDFRITVIKAATIAATPNHPLTGLNFPLLENAQEYVVHGFTYTDYLSELGYTATTGPNCTTGATTGCPSANICLVSNIDRAMMNAHKQAVKFMMGMGYDEDAATTMLTVSSDYGITQLVDCNWGVHVQCAPSPQPNDGSPS